jgi:hypothetical protein
VDWLSPGGRNLVDYHMEDSIRCLHAMFMSSPSSETKERCHKDVFTFAAI